MSSSTYYNRSSKKNIDRSGFWKPKSSPFASQDLITETNASHSNSEGQTSIPFNFQSTSLSLQRQCLPISKHRSQLLYALEKYSVVVIVGETGSGKSTQIPQYLFENGWCDDGFTVVCTQPRRIAAQTLASRVAQEVGTSLGNQVGYTIRFDDRTSPDTAIKYVTDGILLREASLSDPLLSRYSVIMIDEAHELNCNTEILLGVLKKIRRKRKDLRVIVCSATIDAEAFLDYFIPKKLRVSHEEVQNNLNDSIMSASAPGSREDPNKHKRRKRWGKVGDNNQDEKPSGSEETQKPVDIQNRGTIISIDGRQHPVDTLFSEKPVADYVKATVDTCLRIHFEMRHDDGDILCFLATGEEIDSAIKLAEEQATNIDEGSSSQIVFLPLYGTLPYYAQAQVFQKKPAMDKRRRVIFATNIAETSVTVPNISSVIDCGFVKMPYFDPKTGFDRLIVSPISRASARQRAGRAGRIRPGKCYRLYTEAGMAKDFTENTEPEILRTNLSSFIIMLKNIGIHNILSFDLINVPSIPALSQGLEMLYALGAMDEKTNLTKLGFQMSEFPTEPRLSRILLKSLEEEYSCSEEILCIVAAMQVRSLFYQPRTPNQQIDYDSIMEDIRDTQSDHITYLRLMQLHKVTPLNDEDCKERFVNRMALKRACEVKNQLRNFLRKYGRVQGLDMGQSEEQVSAQCRKAIASGLFSNTAKLGNDGRYYSLKGGHMVGISTASVLHKFGMGCEYILFSETYDGSRGGIEVRGVSSIEGKWLRELAPHYFDFSR